MRDNGNVVLGYTSDSILMLDCDLQRENEVKEFAEEYTKCHDLGSALVMRTSKSMQVDLYGRPLGNYCIIFGKVLDWHEIKWHVAEVYRLGMVNRAFTALRDFGSITIRVNAKNNKIPYPEPLHYFQNGDETGVKSFLEYWAMHRRLGRATTELNDLGVKELQELEKESAKDVEEILRVKAPSIFSLYR
jgi:hypothetical protein